MSCTMGMCYLKIKKKKVSFFSITKRGSHSSRHSTYSEHITFYFWITTIHFEYQKTLLVSAYEQLEVFRMALSPWLSSSVCVCVCTGKNRSYCYPDNAFFACRHIQKIAKGDS